MKSLTTLIIILSAATTSFAVEPSRMGIADVGSTTTPQSEAIEKAFISFRISPSQWMPENRYREFLALFEKYKGGTDEIGHAMALP